MPSRLIRLLDEVKRRRLPQTAALYVAVAWGGIEILVFLAESLLNEEAGSQARQSLAVLLVAGFPAAMYLAWTRDLGLKARRLFSAVVVAVFIGGALVYFLPERSTGLQAVVDNSLAVVPFEVCDERPSDRELAGGISIEVFNRLAQRRHLNVKGRASVDRVLASGVSLASTAGYLGVEHLLNGVLCREGIGLTLQAELTDNRGFVVWQGQFNQVVNQAGQVEQQLAVLVDNAVAAQLGDVIVSEHEDAVDHDALEQWHLALIYLQNADWGKARNALRKALDIQPDYAQAVQTLAILEMQSARTADNWEDGIRIARPHAETALAIAEADLLRDPGDVEANYVAGATHQLLGYVEGQLLYRDSHEIDDEDLAARKSRAAAHYADAERLFRTALAAQPNDSGVRLRLVSVMDSRGIERRKETLEILEQGLKHDPWNVGLTQRLAYRLVEFGRLREAMEKLDRFSALPQGKDELLWWSQFEILHDAGRFDEKLAYHIELLVNDPAAYSRGRPLSHLWWTTSSLPLLGLTAEASELYDQIARIPDPEDAGTWPMFAGRTVRQFFLEDAFQATTGSEGEVTETYQPRIEALSNEEILKGWSLSASIDATTLWESGHRERAIQIVEALRHYSGSPGLWAQRQMMYAEQLAAWYVELNRMEDAKPVLQEIASHLQNEVDAGMRHVQALLRLANAYGNLGDTENALLALDTAVEYGGYDMDMCCGDYIPDLVNDKAGARPRHWWTSLEGSPEFEILRTRMRSAVDAQRANIRTLLKTHDMEALLAPLLEPVEPRR